MEGHRDYPREKIRIFSLDGLMQELITVAKKVYAKNPLQASVFDISDQIGWMRGRRAFWDAVIEYLVPWASKPYNELRYFAVCNLSPPSVTSVIGAPA
jgi:hypothetical protein